MAACALGIYHWGATTGVPAELIRLSGEDESEEGTDADVAPSATAFPSRA